MSAVVVGLDENFDYAKLCIACLYIQTGSKFVCTNDQSSHVIAPGRVYPGTGAILEAIQISLNDKNGNQASEWPTVVSGNEGFQIMKDDWKV